MSTACITEVHSFMSYKCETPNQLPNSLPCKTLDGPKMAPLEQQKTTESDALVAEHPDEQYASTGTNSNSNSSENNSDTQQDDEDSVNKLRDLPLSDSPPSVNGAPKGDRDVPFFVPPHLALNYPHNFFQGGKRKPKRVPMGFLYQGANMPVNGQEKLEFDELYHCQKCEFVGRNDDELHVHSRKHDPYECGECGLMSDAPENLKTHMKEEHPKIAASKRGDFIIFHEPESIEISPESSPKNKKTTKVKPFEENIDKPRKTTCKMCNNFTGNSKKEYYDHLEERHSEDGKLLRCHICPFIALYKHHLEYHLRNHFGSKPFVCEQCKYACVNRSMLNSHYKSHSNIYQYSCKNCQYMTKYLHSLKMHLRKYNHEPGQTLNPDGTVNKNAMIDTHGKRRGPKSKKRKRDDHTQEQGESPKSKSSPSPPSPYLVPIMPSQDIRILFNPQIHNNYTGNLCVRAGPSEPSNYVLHSPPSVGSSTFRCAYCEFVSNSLDVYQYHVLSHGAQDHLSYGSFSPKYPAFSQQPYNFGPPGFGSIFSPDSFSRNIANQPTTVESRNINEGRNMDVTNNDIHFQNPISYRKYYDALVNNGCIKKLESASRFPINSQQITQRYHRIREEAEQILKSIGYPSPNGIPTIKEEIPEYMNGIGSPSTKNPIDNGPLDLTIKQPTTPETKCLETGALRGFGSLIGGGMNRASSVSPKIGNEESKVTTQKTNRRKGRAFKLNQYAMESEPLSDGAEAGSEKMPVFNEFKTYSNQRGSKPAVGSAVRKSVPRINFKPTLNATKWNGHDSHEPKPSEFLPFPELAYTEPNCADPQTTGQKARDASDDCWCPHCDMYSASPRLQEYHSSYHSKNDPFTCAKCGLRCNDKDGFNYHIILGSRINGNCINSIEECKS